MIDEPLKIGTKVKVRGTADYGQIVDVRAERQHSLNHMLIIDVMLENGNIMAYDASELKVL